MLGARPPQALRGASRQRSRRRPRNCWNASASCSPSKRTSVAGRPQERLAVRAERSVPLLAQMKTAVRGDAEQNQPQEFAGGSHPLFPLPLGRPDALHHRRPPRHLQQCRRTRHPAPGHRPQKLDVRRFRQRRRPRRHHVHHHRNRQAQRPRSRGVSPHPHRPHRRSPGQAYRLNCCPGTSSSDPTACL